MDCNLEYYKVFYYVGRLGGITAAAEKLCISQPAVSQAIKQLEKSLGSRLFLRTSKGVKLTPEGETLYSYVKRGYEIIENGEANFKKMMDLESGEVRIGASDMTLQFFLLHYLEEFHEMYPKIKVAVTNAPTPETINHLYEGRIDFGIVSTPFEKRNQLESIKVREIETVFVAGNDFAYLKGKTIELNKLAELPLIFLEGRTSTRTAMESFLGEHNVTVSPEFELATSDMIVQFALRNLGIGCVVYDFAKEYIEKGQLFELKFNKRLPKRDFAIVTYEKNPISSAGIKLLDMINSSVK